MIKVIQNRNFQNWFTVTNQKTDEVSEVGNRKQALRLAVKLAKEHKQSQVIVQDIQGMQVIPV